MEHLRQVALSLLLLLGTCALQAQVVQESDSIPEIPTFTDTVGIGATIITDTLVTDSIPDEAYEPDETSIQYDIDTLYWGGDPTTLRLFFHKLEQDRKSVV